jgi:uncharacterized membrane protein HdeD (DUF308 family)
VDAYIEAQNHLGGPMHAMPERDIPDGGLGVVVVADPRGAWPLLLLRGVLAVAFGVLALVWPALTVLALALVFGLYAIVDGVALVVFAIRHHKQLHRWAYVAGGLLGVAAGVVTLLWPHITVVALALLAGGWALVTGIFEIIAAIRLRKQIRGEIVLGLAGALSAVAGIFILWRPIAGAFGIAILLGIYALIYGIVVAVLALLLRARVRQAALHRPGRPTGMAH